MFPGDDDTDSQAGDGELALLEEEATAGEPPRYAVLLHNDHYTTMEFVIEVLQKFFGLGREAAGRVMFKVHTDGKGVAGIFSFEIAETKVMQVTQHAKVNGFPLRVTTEPVHSGADDSDGGDQS